MHVRRYSLFVLALVLTACSSTPSPIGEGGATVNPPRGSANLIGRGELDAFPGQSARQVVERLRPSWLRPGRGSLGAGSVYARVIIDETSRRDLDELNLLYSSNIEYMRYLSAANATTKYGTGYFGGAIEVTTRGR